jgi:uncharacterized membrane protein YeaQ/YmgE (transglycosylase-associated protein family)
MSSTATSGGIRFQEDHMGLIAWIVFGAIAGWIASLINGTNKAQGWLGNIVMGIIGALVGGWLYGLLTDGFDAGFNIGSLIVAIVGALIFSFALSLITGRKTLS